MKNLSLIISILYTTVIYSQDIPLQNDSLLYFTSVQADTVVTPDYYNVYITITDVSEYIRHPKAMRGDHITTCDTLENKLKNKLKSIGFIDTLILHSAGVRPNYNYNNGNTNKKYRCYILTNKSPDEVMLIHDSIKFLGLSGINSEPKFDENRLKQIKLDLKIATTNISKTQTEKYAENIGYKIKNLNSININSNYIGYNQDFSLGTKITTTDIKIQSSGYVNYCLIRHLKAE